MDRTELAEFGEIKQTKHYVQVIDRSLRKALVMSKGVYLEDASKTYENLQVRIFKIEEIKKRHMGKVKCFVKYHSDDELMKILQTYFS